MCVVDEGEVAEPHGNVGYTVVIDYYSPLSDTLDLSVPIKVYREIESNLVEYVTDSSKLSVTNVE